MALPRSKYSKPKHTPGGEYLLNGENYIGWFVVTFRDEYFTGKTLNRASKKLKLISEEIINSVPLFTEDITQPNLDISTTSFWTRYFVQKRSSNRIIEVSKSKFHKFKTVPGFSTAELQWKIQGPAKNKTIKGYSYFGAEHINRESTLALEKILPGISTYIKNYSEFVV